MFLHQRKLHPGQIVTRFLVKLAGSAFYGVGATVGGAAGLAAACLIEQAVFQVAASIAGAPEALVSDMTVQELGLT